MTHACSVSSSHRPPEDSSLRMVTSKALTKNLGPRDAGAGLVLVDLLKRQ